jgi:hypothetical protein
VLYVCNVEGSLGHTGTPICGGAGDGDEGGCRRRDHLAAIEAEVDDEPADRPEYLVALGPHGNRPACGARGVRTAGLITFFTVGPKEARQWTAPDQFAP